MSVSGFHFPLGNILVDNLPHQFMQLPRDFYKEQKSAGRLVAVYLYFLMGDVHRVNPVRLFSVSF